MPRYLIEREFSDALQLRNGTAATPRRSVEDQDAELGVSSLHCGAAPGRRQTWCIHEESVPPRRAAHGDRLPVERITEVLVLDPYFFK